MSILTGMIAPTSGHYNIRYTSEVNQGSRQTGVLTDVQTDVQTDVLTDVQTVTETGANTPLSGLNGAQKHCENHPIDPDIDICDGQKKPRTNAQTNAQTNILSDKPITRVDIEGQTERLSKNSVYVKAGWVQWVWSVVCSGYKQIVEGDQSDSQNVKSEV